MEGDQFDRGVPYFAPVARHPAVLVDAGLPIPSIVPYGASSVTFVFCEHFSDKSQVFR